MSPIDTAFLAKVEESAPRYLRSLRVGSQPGRYIPCVRGVTTVGREMALGWSCFALKTLHMLGTWELLSREEREEWIEFIQDFQRTDEVGAFEDPPEMAFLGKSTGLVAELRRRILGGARPPDAHSVMLAETKQAIATLAEVGAVALRPFRSFPTTPEALTAWLEARDWSKPWGAGGQAAGLVVFIKTQAPAFLAQRDVDELLEVCRRFFAELADPETGAYFRGATPPEHGELVNGAMKVLMALDWLDEPPHHAERLIATTLAERPSPHGCHLVDAIYVLHQCAAGQASASVRDYCAEIVSMIKEHVHPDGGFSFHVRKAQTNYYGVTISRGLDESDIQGTCLLVWALSMIWKMSVPETARWRVLKP